MNELIKVVFFFSFHLHLLPRFLLALLPLVLLYTRLVAILLLLLLLLLLPLLLLLILMVVLLLSLLVSVFGQVREKLSEGLIEFVGFIEALALRLLLLKLNE